MADLFQFELVSTERQLLSEKVAEVVVPGSEGEFGVLKDHSPFISTLKAGLLKVRGEAGSWDEFFVRGGFADIAAGGGLTVLAEQAIPVSEISHEELDQAVTNAQEDVSDAKDDQAKQKAELALSQLQDVVDAIKNS